MKIRETNVIGIVMMMVIVSVNANANATTKSKKDDEPTDKQTDQIDATRLTWIIQ